VSHKSKKKMPREKQIRAYCFTINNYSNDEWASLPKLYEENYASYLIAGKEMGEECKTPHIQGYVYFNGRGYGMSAAHKLPGLARAALIVARGDAHANQKYCSKQGEFIELGKPPKKGARSDITEIKEIIGKGGNMREVIAQATSYQALKTGELLLKYQKAPERPDIKVYWYHGDTGSGKTRTAIKEAGEDYWMSSKNLKWWDNYDGEKKIIIDDFRRDFCTFHELLRITDRYPFKVETKGGFRALLAEEIWITCPLPPEELWQGHLEDLQQLLRRITKIQKFIREPPSEPEVKGNINLDLATGMDSNNPWYIKDHPQ